jgi:mitochondrial protein import protein ZIM17
MAIVFTCTKCDTRSAKTFSRHSYEKGIVLIRCPGCKKPHLIADHLGWFGDNFKIEDLAAEIGVGTLISPHCCGRCGFVMVC